MFNLYNILRLLPFNTTNLYRIYTPCIDNTAVFNTFDDYSAWHDEIENLFKHQFFIYAEPMHNYLRINRLIIRDMCYDNVYDEETETF